MGCGSGKTTPTQPMQRNPQQPLSTQNKTNVTRSRYSTDAPAQPFTKIPSSSESSPKRTEQLLVQNNRQRSPPFASSPETDIKRSEQPLAQNTEPRSVRILSSPPPTSSPIGQNANRNSPKANSLTNGTNSPVSSLTESSDSDSSDGKQTAPINNNLKGLKTRSPSVSPPDRLISKPGKTSRLSTGHIGRCSFCPHCQQLPRDFIPVPSSSSPNLPWILDKPPSKTHQHIIMDHYDEDAIREKVVLEYGRVPGSYDYAPNLTIEEEKNHNHSSSKYCTLPAVIKPGPPIAPSRTPYPNYDILHRHDKRVNKPYTPTLFMN